MLSCYPLLILRAGLSHIWDARGTGEVLKHPISELVPARPSQHHGVLWHIEVTYVKLRDETYDGREITYMARVYSWHSAGICIASTNIDVYGERCENKAVSQREVD